VPFVSVIITAHDWREYLLEAVDSASNQILPKEEYQIIVVKN
jgi:glycosyltransferase involved in cell wall biosynthesis